jgi:phage terminase small subunit
MQKLPTAVRKQRGTHRPDRANATEPQLDPGEPPMPADLDEREKVRWHEIVTSLKMMGVLTPADGIALKELVCCSVEVDRLRAKITGAETQAVLSTQKEMVDRVHPLYATWLGARRELRALWTAFGLDPLARTAVHTVQPAPRAGTAPGASSSDNGNKDSSAPAARVAPAGRYFQ